ncbi:hypothetical protein [Nisaea nitritireducens]|uniref:hypothetical protein n=1 Tax=Nisaea nitritireducens TaxID=568392 RepID=UPI0018674ED1|nr:hypothetical protein [Nisaea nitritireducens]
MTDYWDSYETTPTSEDDLKAYIKERKRRAAQYLRTAKKAHEHIDHLQRIEEAHRKALGGK